MAEHRPADAAAQRRLARAAADNFQFIWRVVRRLGVAPESAVDDAVQRVFEIAARKTGQIQPGTERAFLFKTAVLVSAEERRRHRRAVDRTADDETHALASSEPDPERALEQRRHREHLDAVLEAMPLPLRSVFVLFELEGLSGAEIAALLGLAEGTVSSRLRRARLFFQAEARRLRARLGLRGVLP